MEPCSKLWLALASPDYLASLFSERTLTPLPSESSYCGWPLSLLCSLTPPAQGPAPVSKPCLEHILSSSQTGQLTWEKKGKLFSPGCKTTAFFKKKKGRKKKKRKKRRMKVLSLRACFLNVFPPPCPVHLVLSLSSVSPGVRAWLRPYLPNLQGEHSPTAVLYCPISFIVTIFCLMFYFLF